MKKSKLFLAAIAVAFVFVSCKPDTETKTTLVDFENVTLNTKGISDSTIFKTDNCTFTINDGAFWNGGIVCSSNIDTETAGWNNQYSCIAGSGAIKSKQFGVVYAPGGFICSKNENGNYSIKSMMVTNSTYAYLDMQNGTVGVSKKFVTGDWFKMVIKGYLNKNETNISNYYLADFRNGKTFISRDWEKIDISNLGAVDSVSISFESSDNGYYGMNTPAYVCIDNIEFTQTISTK
ncbi:MAG TPA: DUF4465 domain-containing protein [Paludibacter sp.]